MQIININEIINFIRKLYNSNELINIHSPFFKGNEKRYLQDCIDSTFVSYLGKYVTKFEKMTAEYTGAKYAVAVVNGTVALQIALQLSGVEYGDEVITQPLTFVATANAISHCGAKPIFTDVDLDTMGMSPDKLYDWLNKNVKFNKKTGKPYNHTTMHSISAIVPMHTFGHPCRIDEIVEIANKYKIPVVEDSAESLGSFYKGKHTGTFGLAGIISYNGNKIITTGGGGMIITNNEEFAKKARHITTTGKVPHKWEYIHDVIAYNFRLTNVNAAIGVAQMEYLNEILDNKKETAGLYKEFFSKFEDVKYIDKPQYANPNYWLNIILFRNIEDRNNFLEMTNNEGIQTRPAWKLLNELKMYKNCMSGNLDNSKYINEKLINIPSGIRK